MRQLLDGFTAPHRLSDMAENTPILVAFSGGADSSALLYLLADYAKRHGTPLSVAHVDHKLRGRESDADREFCRATAQSYGLPFYLLEADVAALAKENHRGVEEQARLTRYQFFAEVMRAHGIPLLATAHNADDNAETTLFHLARGSGLRGLCGIPATRGFEGGKIIRPILGASKQDVLSFCHSAHIEYVTDRTNDDVTYARNRIRHDVLPHLTEINSAAVTNISRACSSLLRDCDYLEQATEDFLAHYESQNAVPLEALNQAHSAIAYRAVATLLSRFSEDVRAVHVEAVRELALRAVPHASVDLPVGIRAAVENGTLVIGKADQTVAPLPYRYPIKQGVTEIPEAAVCVAVDTAEYSHKNHTSLKNIYKKATTIKISSATINGSLWARPRKEGDTILSRGMHKKVKKLMCDRKIPLPLRNRLPLLEDDCGLLWIPLATLRDGADSHEPALHITLYYND